MEEVIEGIFFFFLSRTYVHWQIGMNNKQRRKS